MQPTHQSIAGTAPRPHTKHTPFGQAGRPAYAGALRRLADCRDCCVRLCGVHHAPDEAVAAISSMRRVREREARTFVLRQGDRPSALYVLRTGSAKSTLCGPDGVEQVVDFHFAGDVLGLDGLDGTPHRCSVQTLEDSTLCELPLAEMDTLLQSTPGLLRQLLVDMNERSSRQHWLQLVLSRYSVQQRVAFFLDDLSRRFAARSLASDVLDLSMSRDEIASFLGVCSESTSRALTALSAEGILEIERRHIRIVDMEALRQTFTPDAPGVRAA